MIKFKLKKYLPAFSGLFIFLLFFWIYPVHSFYDWLQTEGAPILSTEEIFLNIMGPNGNFINPTKILALYLVPFILVLNALLHSDKPVYIVRLKSRKAYVTKCLSGIFLCSFLFVLMIEGINVTGASIVFGLSIVIDFSLIKYSLIDFVTLFLFYSRVGIMLLIIGVAVNKKLAQFITMALYFAEYFAGYFFNFLNMIWLPNKDAISVIYLLTGDMRTADVISIIIRGLIINIMLVLFSYYLFGRKDIIEKKENL